MSELPATMAPPSVADAAFEEEERDSFSGEQLADMTVAVLVEDAPLREMFHAMLRGAGWIAEGESALPTAGLILAAVNRGGDAASTAARVRGTARPDAAILLYFAEPSSDHIHEAHLVGATACLQGTLTTEHLLSVVLSAHTAHEAKSRVADLSRQLDVETHFATIGRMTAGLHHEINNPLSVAMMNLVTMREDAARLRSARRSLETARHQASFKDLERACDTFLGLSATIEVRLSEASTDAEDGVQRIAHLLFTMRTLVGGVQKTVLRVDVASVVREVLAKSTEILRGVEVEQVVDEPLIVLADPTLLGPILLNLLTNAAHAARSLSSPRVRVHVYPVGDEKVVISVRDNGPGVSDDMKHRIFEPFFTTRRAQGGVGLGLTLCRAYALAMNADISLSSVLGRGACFRVRLLRAL